MLTTSKKNYTNGELYNNFIHASTNVSEIDTRIDKVKESLTNSINNLSLYVDKKNKSANSKIRHLYKSNKDIHNSIVAQDALLQGLRDSNKNLLNITSTLEIGVDKIDDNLNKLNSTTKQHDDSIKKLEGNVTDLSKKNEFNVKDINDLYSKLDSLQNKVESQLWLIILLATYAVIVTVIHFN